MSWRPQPGYVGMYTTAEAHGALPNGTRVVKALHEPGDGTPLGTAGTVLGSIATPEVLRPRFPGVAFLYFVEWDDKPRLAVGLIDRKIRPLELDP